MIITINNFNPKLIQFKFDISDYEQPRNGEKSTNDSNKTVIIASK